MGLKKYLPKRWWLLYPLYAGVGLVVLLAADAGLTWYWQRIEIGVETTRITAPLTAEGYPDYAGALNDKMGAGVTKENNAAVLLLRLCEDEKSLLARVKGIIKALDIEAGFVPVRWEEYNKYLERTTTAPAEGTDTTAQEEAADALVERLRTMPWRGADYPQVTAWLEANRGALELLRQASVRERFYVPVVDEAGQTRDHEPEKMKDRMFETRVMDAEPIKMLLMQALRCLGEGDGAGYERDVVAALACARVKSQPTACFMNMLVGLNEEIFGYQVLQAGLGSGRLDAAQRQRMSALLERMGEPANLAGLYDGAERWGSLDTVVGMSRPSRIRLFEQGVGYVASAPGFSVLDHFLPLDFNGGLRYLNWHYDRIVVMMQMPDYAARQAAMRAWERELATPRRGDMFDGWVGSGWHFAKLLLPSVYMVDAKRTTVLAQRVVTLGMLALAREWADKGAYPEALPAGLVDPFTGQALVYRREGAGYVLYSVGPDGKDDGGKAPAERASRDQDYDLVVRVER